MRLDAHIEPVRVLHAVCSLPDLQLKGNLFIINDLIERLGNENGTRKRRVGRDVNLFGKSRKTDQTDKYASHNGES
jgi:hypothetical protein